MAITMFSPRTVIIMKMAKSKRLLVQYCMYEMMVQVGQKIEQEVPFQ